VKVYDPVPCLAVISEVCVAIMVVLLIVANKYEYQKGNCLWHDEIQSNVE
jgi:hypothetical protein